MRSCFLCAARRGLLWFAVRQLRPLLARLRPTGRAGWRRFVQHSRLQVLAIAFVAQLAADLCREAGLAPPRSVWNSWAAFWLCSQALPLAAKLAGLVFVLFIVIAFPAPAAAAELPAGVRQILRQSELTPDKLVHITLQERCCKRWLVG
ncbi:MAG: hypothetical protein ACLTZH_02515 [Subdoligranulum sp.]